MTYNFSTWSSGTPGRGSDDVQDNWLPVATGTTDTYTDVTLNTGSEAFLFPGWGGSGGEPSRATARIRHVKVPLSSGEGVFL